MFKKGELPLSAVAKRQLTQRIISIGGGGSTGNLGKGSKGLMGGM